MQIKICPKCGMEFKCEHSIKCWCMSYNIPENKRKYLRENYNDCLCESCLKEFAKEVK